MIDLKNLRELANSARLWGPLDEAREGEFHGESVVGGSVEGNFYDTMRIDTANYDAENFAMILGRFYAAMNPMVVLQLLDLLDAAQNDAARYQWLRDNGIEKSFKLVQTGGVLMTVHSDATLDSAIDAAMASKA